MNPYLETIRLLGLTIESSGEWAFVYLLLNTLGASFSDGGNNVHTHNMPKEALRRISLIDRVGLGYQRLAVMLNSAIVAQDAR